ncbi:MAG: sensor histidine kinase, partial [Pseudomonadota bacterium]
DLVQDLAETYGPVIEDTGRTLRTEITPTAPIDGDRELLVQLVANLLQNAIRHTPEGSDITIAVQQNRLSVTDTGPGIPTADRDKVLEPLFRLEHSRTTEGAGLGLALVRAVADLHDAKLTLTDTTETPSGLTVTLFFSPL